MRTPSWRIVLVLALLVPAAALGCLWDYDTLKQERSRFPGALELITGKFLRHSEEFYRWRIDNRLQKLQNEPRNVYYLDDLAVAYEKVGDHAKAIETILKKEQIDPGIYETYSNLGTFHILAGDFEKGLPFIDKALALNPNAHFGREKYQKWLVEYAMEKRKDGKLTFPMQDTSKEYSDQRSFGFHEFLARPGGTDYLGEDEARQEAVKGVLGMMRFANHENPLLLEALGDLLFRLSTSGDGKQLAARAYLKASYVVEDQTAKDGYRKLAERAIYPKQHPGTLQQITLAEVEDNFQKELADAGKWYDELYAKELQWIAEGKDVEAEFDRLYAEDPEIEGRTDGAPWPIWVRVVFWFAVIVGSLTALTVWRRHRRPPAA